MGFLQQRHHLRLCGCAGSSCIRCRRNALNVALATHPLHGRRIRCIRCRRNALNVADSAGWAVVLDSALHPLPAQRAQCSHKHPFASYALERPQSGGPLGFADRPFARSGLRRARPGRAPISGRRKLEWSDWRFVPAAWWQIKSYFFAALCGWAFQVCGSGIQRKRPPVGHLDGPPPRIYPAASLT
jgi:hypothetical protein